MSEYGFFIGTAVFVLIVEFVAILKSNHDEEKVYRRGFEDGKNHFNCQDVKPIILDTLNGDIDWECPLCGKEVMSDAESRNNYCGECGCKFDWSEIDESSFWRGET